MLDEKNEDIKAAILSGQALGAAAPDDIANLCLFLTSDASRMITGRVIPIDGGRF
jgi:NAD(P)-dependent dehydrogenase (short-subunit alcohol dehydrogenase family)